MKLSPNNLKAAFMFLLLIASIFRALCQYANVKISDKSNPNETSIAIDPRNTSLLFAAANINSIYRSQDGGKSWSAKSLTSDYGVWGDPCLVIDTAGKIYFFHLSNPPSGSWIDRIVCQRSDDRGQLWNNGAGIGLNGTKEQDKEWAAVNPVTNEIYVTWTQFDDYGSENPAMLTNILFSRSADEGNTWTQPVRINKVPGDCIDSDNTVEGAVPAVGPGGEIYVAWAGPSGLVFDRSTDNGNTWLGEDIFVSDIPGGWDYAVPGIYRCNGLPVTCCDLSNTANRGTIYINWTDQRNGDNDTDVWLVKSTDSGNTWSSPKRVNDDPAGRHQFFTWMTIDQATGYLWFVFYDRREYIDNQTDVWMAVSKDGGETFQNFKVSESPFSPNNNVFFGDYTGIAAHNNVVRPIWTRLQGTSLSVWTALVDTLQTTNLREEEKTSVSVGQVYPNPFYESTAFSFKLKKQTRVSLWIFDVLGNKITTIYDQKWLPPGKYIEKFNPDLYNLPAGVYYFHLTGDGINRQRKIVYQK